MKIIDVVIIVLSLVTLSVLLTSHVPEAKSPTVTREDIEDIELTASQIDYRKSKCKARQGVVLLEKNSFSGKIQKVLCAVEQKE